MRGERSVRSVTMRTTRAGRHGAPRSARPDAAPERPNEHDLGPRRGDRNITCQQHHLTNTPRRSRKTLDHLTSARNTANATTPRRIQRNHQRPTGPKRSARGPDTVDRWLRERTLRQRSRRIGRGARAKDETSRIERSGRHGRHEATRAGCGTHTGVARRSTQRNHAGTPPGGPRRAEAEALQLDHQGTP